MWCVIPAAGRATRMAAAAGGPKALLEVGGRPLVLRLLDDLAPEATEACLVVAPAGASAVRAALGDRRGRMRLHYVVQPRPCGVAEAVGRAAGLVEGPFVVVMGDVYYENSLVPAVSAWRESGVAGAVLVEPPGGPAAGAVGLVRVAGGRVTAIRKATGGGELEARVCGMMAFPESAMPLLRSAPPGPTGEAELEDAVRVMLAAGTEFLALPYRGWRRNVNVAADLDAVRRRAQAAGGGKEARAGVTP